jgi:hypothetical protein
MNNLLSAGVTVTVDNGVYIKLGATLAVIFLVFFLFKRLLS